MSRVCWAVVEGTPWRVLRLVGGEQPAEQLSVSPGSEEWADSILGALRQLGYAGEPVLLGVASRSCLVVHETPTEQAWDQAGETLRYALEESLPLPAEDFTAVLVGRKPDRLAIVLPLKDWMKKLSACESAGIDIRAISPWALLGLQSYQKDHAVQGDVAWRASEWNLLSLSEGQLRSWKILPNDISESRASVRLHGATRSESGETEPPFFVGPSIPDRAAGSTVDTDALSARGAAAVLSEREQPWVNFRQGRLAPSDPHRPYRGAMRNLFVAGIGLLMALVVMLRIRASQFDALAASYALEQADVFREVFPNQRVPAAVRSRLDSEHRRLLIQNGPDDAADQVDSATETMTTLLNAVPQSIRCRIHHVRCDGGQAAVDCEVRSLADAAILQKAFAEAGFEVTPPRVELVGGLVPLRLSLKRVVVSKAAPQGAPPS